MRGKKIKVSFESEEFSLLRATVFRVAAETDNALKVDKENETLLALQQKFGVLLLKLEVSLMQELAR